MKECGNWLQRNYNCFMTYLLIYDVIVTWPTMESWPQYSKVLALFLEPQPWRDKHVFATRKKKLLVNSVKLTIWGRTHKFHASVLRLVSCVHKLEGKIFSLESDSAVLKTTTENLAIWNWTKSILNPVSFLPTISPEVARISSMPLNCIHFHRAKMTQPDKRKAISTNCCLLRLHIDSFSR